MSECRVLFIKDLAAALGTSHRTIERELKRGTFPIPTLPAIGARPRWSPEALERYLSGERAVPRLKRVG